MSITMIERDFPKSLPEFLERFGTEEACAEYLVRQKWPDGFRCECGSTSACLLSTRAIYVCHGCRRQHSVASGTAFHGTRKGLRTWFLALYLMVSSKQGLSAKELHRQRGFKRWMLGTHQGAIPRKHLQRYLSEFEFRFNRRTSHVPTHLFQRLMEGVVRNGHHPYATLVVTVPSTGCA